MAVPQLQAHLAQLGLQLAWMGTANSMSGLAVVSALSKAWCVNCFSCSACNMKLTLKNKFVEFDMKPVCKRCYERFPLELKKRLKKLSDLSSRKAQPKPVGVNSV